MKTIKGKLYFVYALIFISLILTVFTSFIAIDTYNQHLMLTELLGKQILSVERVVNKVSLISEIRAIDNDKYNEISISEISNINEYKTDVDNILNSFISREYLYDGEVKKLKFNGEFEITFDKALENAKVNWSKAKDEIDILIMPENQVDSSYKEKLLLFENTNIILVKDVDIITQLCRNEAHKQKTISRILQAVTLILALIILIWLIVFVKRSIQNPIMQVRSVFKKMGEGNLDVVLSRDTEDEFKSLFEDFNTYINNRNAILRIEDSILSEDNLRVILKEMLINFSDFVKLDNISIVYSDSFERHVKISSENLSIKEVDEVEVFSDIKCIDELSLAMPIKVNNVYLGYALFVKKEKYTDRDIKFVSGLEKKIVFAFYKSLIFKDLLSIVTSGLADMTESRDPETKRHLIRTSYYSQIIAKTLLLKDDFKDEVDEDFIENLKFASPMHDIGKVAVPDYILLKPGKLTIEEFKIMKTHSKHGAKILSHLNDRFEKYNMKQFKMAEEVAHYHQEKYDGSGYPEQLIGNKIPLSARISTVADVFDALTSKRPYKEAFSLDKSYNIMKESSGSHFDSRIVDAFFESIEEIEKIYFKYREI